MTAGTSGLTRRAALRLLLMLWASAAISCRAGQIAEEEREDTDGQPSAETPGIEAIGRQYLREHPDLADATLLSRRLGISGDVDRRLDNASIYQRVRAAHSLDLREGRIVALGGWILSETEASLAALVWLDTARS